jgi:hypothetical protein
MTREQNIFRLDVAMRGALSVRVFQRVGDVMENSHSLRDRQLARTLQSRAECLSFDERHRVIKEIVFRAGEKERHDVRMLQPRGELNLAAKPIDVESGAELGRQNFDDDLAAERDFANDEDTRHPATQIVRHLIAFAERALQSLGEISDGSTVQSSSPDELPIKYRSELVCGSLIALPASRFPLPASRRPPPASRLPPTSSQFVNSEVTHSKSKEA